MLEDMEQKYYADFFSLLKAAEAKKISANKKSELLKEDFVAEHLMMVQRSINLNVKFFEIFNHAYK